MSKELETMNIVQIEGILPHRFPFLMVDRVDRIHRTENAVGSWIEGVKNVTCNEPFFQGHFPGNPVFPGVLQIEACGQLSALLVYTFNPVTSDKYNVFLMGLDNARYRAPVFPGDTLELKATITKARNKTIWVTHVEARVRGQLVFEADIMATLAPKNVEQGLRSTSGSPSPPHSGC